MTAAAAADGDARPERSNPSAQRQSARKRSNPLGRLRRGETIYLVAAILLFVLMFFDWYGVGWKNGSESLGGVITAVAGGSAWQTLEVLPLFLMLTVAVAVGAALLRLGGSDWKPAIPPGVAVCVLGLLAALGILGRMVSPPDLGGEGIGYSVNLELGIFLALAAALGVAYGGWRAMADEGTSFADVGKRLEAPSRPAKKKPVASAEPATAPKADAKKPASPRRSPRKKP
jgi:hypothetical protein